MSIAFDSRITANLSPALRAARVNAQCPSEAAVRAFNLCGGVNPSNPPLPALGFAPPALVKASTRPRSSVRAAIHDAPRRGAWLHFHLIHRYAVPLPLKGKDNCAA